MLYFMEGFEIANYADESTPFRSKLNHKSAAEELEILSSVWFNMASEQLYHGQYW